MDFNFKNTHDPTISDKYMEFRYMGEFINHGVYCTHFDPKPMEFLTDERTSQWVISEAAANCLAT